MASWATARASTIAAYVSATTPENPQVRMQATLTIGGTASLTGT